jgi:hypothetical protein
MRGESNEEVAEKQREVKLSLFAEIWDERRKWILFRIDFTSPHSDYYYVHAKALQGVPLFNIFEEKKKKWKKLVCILYYKFADERENESCRMDAKVYKKIYKSCCFFLYSSLRLTPWSFNFLFSSTLKLTTNSSIFSRVFANIKTNKKKSAKLHESAMMMKMIMACLCSSLRIRRRRRRKEKIKLISFSSASLHVVQHSISSNQN